MNAGNSSILLGEKPSDDGYYLIGLNDLDGARIKAKNCFISTSSTSVQGKTINGVTYSHIITPETGSAINEHDAVIVVSEEGWLGDVLSTSMMCDSISQIQAIEKARKVKTIVIRNNKIEYSHPDIEVLYK